jgi:hypothetical protein
VAVGRYTRPFSRFLTGSCRNEEDHRFSSSASGGMNRFYGYGVGIVHVTSRSLSRPAFDARLVVFAEFLKSGGAKILTFLEPCCQTATVTLLQEKSSTLGPPPRSRTEDLVVLLRIETVIPNLSPV